MKNCCLFKYASNSFKEEVRKTNETNKKIRITGEMKIFQWLKKNFPEMKFRREYEPDWVSPLRYDVCSEQFKVIIESDGIDHFKYIFPMKNYDYKTTMKRDRLKNKLAIKNGFTIIRIFRDDIIFSKGSWDNIIFNYLQNIKKHNINNTFLWYSSRKDVNDAYLEQYYDLYSDKKILKNISNETVISLSKKSPSSEKSETNNYVVPLYSITEVRSYIFDCFNKLYPGILHENKGFKASWLDNSRRFNLGSNKFKFVITIDNTFFEPFYNCEPDKIRIRELNKTIEALHNGFKCVRIQYELIRYKTYIQNQIKNIIDSIVNNTCPKITYIKTKIDEYDKIYDSFIENALNHKY